MALDLFNRSQAMDALANEPDKLSTPSAFSIREVTGYKREIQLTGWCLPFRPAKDSTKQRMKVEYYPGATEAVVQVFGPDHTDMTIQGAFITRYMQAEDSFLYHEGTNFNVTKGGTEPTRVDSAERAKELMTDLCKGGQEVVVTWGDLPFGTTARGFIRGVSFNEHNPQRIEWEVEFVWVSDKEYAITPSIPTPDPDPQSLYDKVNDFLNTVQEAVNDLGDAYNEYVVQNIRKINTTLEKVNGLVSSAYTLLGKPGQFARDVMVTAQNVKQDIVDTQAAILGFMSQYTTLKDEWNELATGMSFMPWASTGDRPSDSADEQTSATKSAIEISQAAKDAAWEADVIAKAARKMVEPNIIDIYTAKTGDTLRRVSQAYYGTPSKWQDLADYNGISNDRLDPGDVVIIPVVVV